MNESESGPREKGNIFPKILSYEDIVICLYHFLMNSTRSLKNRLSVVFLIIFEQLFVCRRHAEAGIRNQGKEKTTKGALWLVKLVSFSRWRTGSGRFRSTNKLQLQLLSSRCWLFRSRSKLGRVRVNLQFLTSQIFVKIFFCGELPFLLTLWCWHKKKDKYSRNPDSKFFMWLSFFIASFFTSSLYRPFSGQVFLFVV